LGSRRSNFSRRQNGKFISTRSTTGTSVPSIRVALSPNSGFS